MQQERIHSAPNDRHSDHDGNMIEANSHDDFPSILEVEEQLLVKKHQEKIDHASSHVMRRTDIVNDELHDDAVRDLNPASAHRSTAVEESSFLESSPTSSKGSAGRTTTAALFLASDLSLVTGLERTFFAALNNVSLLVLTGVGLMMVGNGDKTATGSGISMLVSALLCTVVATMLHIHRVWQIRNHSYVSYNETCIWITFVGVITVASLIFEIYFAVLHPYLFREKVVTISTEDVI